MAPGSAEVLDDPEIGIDPVDDANVEAKIINEEYKTWKKNSPFLYDMILSTALEWPTLTTQWFPDVKTNPDKNFSTHRLLIGTHTSNGAPNYLQIANVELPKHVATNDKDDGEEKEEVGGFGGSKDVPSVKLVVEQKIDHEGEVNKARYQPQNPNVIATMSAESDVLVFDRTKHASIPTGICNPQARLKGHKLEGYGLNWNPHQIGHLVTGSDDKTVRLWDLTTLGSNSNIVNAARVYTHHSAIVNDVQYHPMHTALIGTVSDDLTLQILDVRQESNSNSAVSTTGHTESVNSIAFNPASDFVLATGSSDKTIGIWDMRNLKETLHVLEGHNEAVTSLSWHPTEEAILGSGSYDRRVIFWDLSRCGEEQLPDDAEDGPPELLFMHGGHTNRVADFSWNPNEPWVVCSAAEDNLIQVWKVADAIVGKDLDDVPVEELER